MVSTLVLQVRLLLLRFYSSVAHATNAIISTAKISTGITMYSKSIVILYS